MKKTPRQVVQFFSRISLCLISISQRRPPRVTQGFPGSPSPKEAPREDPKWLKQRSSDRMGPLGASRRPSRAADMRPERTTRRKTCVLRVCRATQDPLMWPKLAPGSRYWTVSRGSWALSGDALALATLRDQPQRLPAAPRCGKHMFYRFFVCFQAPQDPQMWPKLAQGGPGIALLGGFQGLLGALWGPPWRWQRSRISHSGPREPLEAEKHVFSRVFWRGAPPDGYH